MSNYVTIYSLNKVIYSNTNEGLTIHVAHYNTKLVIDELIQVYQIFY